MSVPRWVGTFFFPQLSLWTALLGEESEPSGCLHFTRGCFCEPRGDERGQTPLSSAHMESLSLAPHSGGLNQTNQVSPSAYSRGVSSRSGFPCDSAGKESACNAGDLGSTAGLGRSPGGGKGYPLHYSGLENSMDSIVPRVAESRTRLSDSHFHFSSRSGGLESLQYGFLVEASGGKAQSPR